MSMHIKEGHKVYEYLDALGVLKNGSLQDIIEAKKSYWKQVRNEWKRNKRKSSYVYSVYYTEKENKIIAETAKKNKTSITNYIKFQSFNRSIYIDNKIIGQIRKISLENFSTIQYAVQDGKISSELATTLTQHNEDLYHTIIKILTPLQ